MTIIGTDGIMIFIKLPAWEYKKVVKAIANMDDDDPEEK